MFDKDNSTPPLSFFELQRQARIERNRMIQAGVVPMTTLQVMFEWQRDWARYETYDGCMEILQAHSAYGIGVRYAKAMLGEHAGEGGAGA